MCGRFTITRPLLEYVKLFGLSPVPFDFYPNFNAAPAQKLPIISSEKADCIQLYEWGLTPSWMTETNKKNRLINARAESIQDKPTFRESFKKRRCVVLADGFYEWKKEGKKKQPYYIHLKDKASFVFAGLWDTSKEGKNQFSIVTTKANDCMKDIHDRMPAILQEDQMFEWLHQDMMADDLMDLLAPYSASNMVVYPVGLEVNDPTNNFQGLVERLGD